MFGIGPFEFLVIAALALIVIGPDKFPEFARVAMKTINDLRTYVGEAKRDIEREMRPVKKEFNQFSKVDAKDYLEKLAAGTEENVEDSDSEMNREEDPDPNLDTASHDTSADEAQDSNLNPTGAEPFMDPENDPSIHGGYNMEPSEPDWTENIGDHPIEDTPGVTDEPATESTTDTEDSEEEKKQTAPTYPPEPFDG